MGFVFIEANVKKWGLAPMTGSLAPPPPYGSEAGSILLEGGKHGVPEGQGWLGPSSGTSIGSGGGGRSQGRSRSATVRPSRQQARSPGPERSPTDISLAQLSVVDSGERETADDPGEGTSQGAATQSVARPSITVDSTVGTQASGADPQSDPQPPEYESPDSDDEETRSKRRPLHQVDSDNESTPRASTSIRSSQDGARIEESQGENRPLLGDTGSNPPSPPIPSYDAAVGGSSREHTTATEQTAGLENSPER